MSQCYNCGTEFTLTDEEIKCDSCNEIVNFPCWNCGNWFCIFDVKTQKKRNSCKVCGYFECPHCGTTHGRDCPTDKWQEEIKEIILSNNSLEIKINMIINFIANSNFNPQQTFCHRKVYRSRAKEMNKLLLAKCQGYRCKNIKDKQTFISNLNKIYDIEPGTEFTIEQLREEGSDGKELRDWCYLAVCYGWLEVIKVKKVIDGNEKEVTVFRRILTKGQCPYFHPDKAVIKTKSGKLKKSNKDCCALHRNFFVKDGEKSRENRI